MALISFLDRFSYKNPKKPTEKGISAMQPKFARKSLVMEPVPSIVSKAEKDIPEEEVVLLGYHCINLTSVVLLQILQAKASRTTKKATPKTKQRC
jgi:hypothetical protein